MSTAKAGGVFSGNVPFCPLTLLWLRIKPERVFCHFSPFPKQSPPPCPHLLLLPLLRSPGGWGRLFSPITFYSLCSKVFCSISRAGGKHPPPTHPYTHPPKSPLFPNHTPWLTTTSQQTLKPLNASSKFPKQTDQMSVYHTLMTQRQQV